MKLRFLALAALVIAALSIFAWVVPTTAISLKSTTDTEAVQSLAPILKKVVPGVVNIAVRGTIPVKDNPLYSDPFFRRFFDLPERPPERGFQSAGSGIIVDAESTRDYPVLARRSVLRSGGAPDRSTLSSSC